ncbi:MAG: 4-(cytidine 5'-diphospho)-2-C-methyl-D-erythritol kinase [Wolbachia endosymbiont of Tyrophagus putrescentiae]|nr:4-(cytidine 5'-diphospho)-2-C-methyl-D-erythritol kinase [Wolbachia endosymbiont of Tyrophagus putrescentiae]
MKVFCVKAYAKINLFLHITSKKETGYHSIESLFAFANLANFLEIRVECKKYRYDNSEVKFVNSESKLHSRYNTVMKAINSLLRYGPTYTKISVKVVKNIPTASGLGSGSSDAGAVIRTLGRFWDIDQSILNEIALDIGADVPASIESKPVFVSGVGEELCPVQGVSLPTDIVLVKPKKKFLSTPEVYSKYTGEFSQSIDWHNEQNLLELVQNARNDLQEAAISLVPEIQEVISALELQKGCVLARMSGSGVACFGMFDNKENAKAAVVNIKAKYPEWWVCNTQLII